jgi:uncharacterized protein (DUF4415 family)
MNSEATGPVRFQPDPDKSPVLAAGERQAWEILKTLRNDEIDFSDIPPQTAGGWRHVSELVPAENKQQITLRLDADLLAFFRATGRRYQSRINAVLREYVSAQKKAV